MIAWTEFKSTDARGHQVRHVHTWPEMLDYIGRAGPFPSKPACPLLKLATFTGQRDDAHMDGLTGIEGDYDGGLVSIEDALARLEAHGIRAAIHPSASHTLQRPRWRVLAPLATTVAKSERSRLVDRLNGALLGILASESWTLSQPYFFGQVHDCPRFEVHPTFGDPEDGHCIDDLHELDAIAIPKPHGALAMPVQGEGIDPADAFGQRVQQLGRKLRTGDGRRALLKSLIASRSARGWRDRSDLMTLVRGVSAMYFDPSDPIDEADIAGIVSWATARDVRAAQAAASLAAALTPGALSATSGADAETGELPALGVMRPGSFQFIPAGDLLAQPAPVVYLVDELFEAGSLLMLFAPPESFKSFVAIDWSASIATGTPWMGRETMPGSVFYLAGEGHAGLSRRLKAWELHRGVSLAAAPLFISKVPAALLDPASAEAVSAAVEDLAVVHGAPAFIVVDTLARNLGSGDESSNADLSVYVQHMDRIRTRFNCAVLTVHHPGHENTERARGGSSLPAAVDYSFVLKRAGDSSHVTFKPLKNKDGEKVLPFELEAVRVELDGWMDAKGRQMASLALVPAEADAEAAGRRMTPVQREAMQAYCRAAVALEAVHGTAPDAAHVHVDEWRAEFYRTSTADGQEAKKKSFQRVRGDLVKLGMLSVENDVYRCPADDAGLIAARMLSSATGTRDTAGTNRDMSRPSHTTEHRDGTGHTPIGCPDVPAVVNAQKKQRKGKPAAKPAARKKPRAKPRRPKVKVDTHPPGGEGQEGTE